MPHLVSQQLVLDRVRKVIVAGYGKCRVRVTVLGGVSLRIDGGEAVGLTGALPLARSMLCAIAAGVARPDSGRVLWGERGLSGVRYAPAGDAPRAVQLRAGGTAGLIILDAALVDGAPAPDIPALVGLLRPWLAVGGSALVAAPMTERVWPWRIVELAGGQLRHASGAAPAASVPWPASTARRVAERYPDRVAPGVGDQ